MKEFIGRLKKCQLFAGVSEQELEAMTSCMDARECRYRKGEYVFRQGEQVQHVAVLVEGALHVQMDDYWGNRTIVDRMAPGETFGEAYAAPKSGALLNDVIAVEDSTVILFDVRRMLAVCSSACRFHSLVVQNLFFAISDQNRQLLQKLDHVCRRTTREKLISYLSEQAKRRGRSDFEIPFNRQQLADFLSVDRSAMSSELGKMRDEGLVSFEKNRFRLL